MLLGYIASLLIGISLGLIGGGGSILTMPVMVYLFGVSPLMATSYSLFIVGSTSMVGAVQQFFQGKVNVRMGLLFAVVSMVTVFIARKWVVPFIPLHIATVFGVQITKSVLTMLLFAALMVVAAIFMMKGKQPKEDNLQLTQSINLRQLVIFGIGIGLITGILGAGGGFLLIPAMVLILHLPMKTAVGTSLLVIALNSLIGFMGNIGDAGMDWKLLSTVTILAVAGIFLGTLLSRKIPGNSLKKGFGWFVLLMGIYILVKEFSNLL
ncbi:hypothetical protein SAMN05444266_102307 [Chitinophaga jiangningensis]|uniref:Probable membrane transporter protein n=1 Tax=Chitinophaga jiangningensis TaxID=1419482 RepID=A0A1M6YH77_9BACT|nr:sulfite exporter TauE/SafE family protein [Chitinophaga jiangningensis]SHL17369.1 hypothetical protein SAMN05444266_102307 [Chitinophaga jiangningensis]